MATMTSVIDRERNVEVITYYHLKFPIADNPKNCWFSFPCDEKGNVDVAALYPEGKANYEKCQRRDGVLEPFVQKSVEILRLCSCGSCKYPEPIHDYQGIFIASVCDDCREERLAPYNPAIFEPGFEYDEPLDEDY